jgi:DNA transposition AAA+ family ATPase
MTNIEQKNNPHFRQTPYVKAAIVLVSTVREQTDCRMGAIMGVPGCGKTEISKNIAEVFQATRLCAYTGIGRRKLVQDLASAMGHANPTTGSMDAILSWLKAVIGKDTLICIDEADCLSWKHLEIFRWLADECGAGIILFGTEILERTFADPRSGAYLARLSRRIGTKRISVKPFNQDEVAQYILSPYFEQMTQTAAKLFHKSCNGIWGDAMELVRACQDIMRNKQETKLTEAIVREAVELRK